MVPLSVAKLLSGTVGYPMMSSEYYKHRDLLPRGWMKWLTMVAKEREYDPFVSPLHSLLEADISRIADNQMIKHVNVEDPSSFHQLPGDLAIFW